MKRRKSSWHLRGSWPSIVVMVITVVFTVMVFAFGASQIVHVVRWGHWYEEFETLNAYVLSLEAAVPAKSGRPVALGKDAVARHYCFLRFTEARVSTAVEEKRMRPGVAGKLRPIIRRGLARLGSRMTLEQRRELARLAKEGPAGACNQSLFTETTAPNQDAVERGTK